MLCRAGSFNPYSNGSCTSCGLGSFSVPGMPLCTLCPFGTYTNAIDDWATSQTTACVPCRKNEWSASRGVPCTRCPVNTFSAGTQETSNLTCRPCDANQCSAGGEDCQYAPPGRYADPARCEQNYYALLKTPPPLRRALAAQIDTASIFPRCDPGTFSDERGLVLCKLCPSGTFNPVTGAFSMDSCVSCKTVSTSHVSDAQGAASPDACVSCAAGEGMRYSNGTHCLGCPAGLWCDGSPDMLLCMGRGEHCLGAAGCAPGYGGYRCQACARGYFPDFARSTGGPAVSSGYVDASIECKECPAAEWSKVVGVFIAMLAALVLLGFCVRWGRSASAPPALSAALYRPAHCCVRLFKRLEHVHEKHSLLWGMFGLHMKRLVILHNAAGLTLPTATRQWLSWSAFFSLASADVLRPSCILPWNQDTSWLAIVVFCVCTALLLLAVDYCRLASMAKKNPPPDDNGTEPLSPNVEDVKPRAFWERLTTNSDSDYTTTLWAASFVRSRSCIYLATPRPPPVPSPPPSPLPQID
jgi:hypothetical protein